MSVENERVRGERNRTMTLSESEKALFLPRLLHSDSPLRLAEVENRTINQDLAGVLPLLPEKFVDLLFLDPPYNLTKSFNGRVFKQQNMDDYGEYLDNILGLLVRVLKPDASIYICGDWRSSAAIHYVASRYFTVRNRITWEREKGRGAKQNWKNCAEDIWFCTMSENYFFNVEAVKLKRKVIAPYRHLDGAPKDWEQTNEGGYRDTYPSNLWTDLTIPFWSMAENTDHPTQKPEKLLAKIILASTTPGQLVLDPFLGSGTTSVVAKKLGRQYLGIEIDETYCCYAEKRLEIAALDSTIQGYANGVFWERNTVAEKREFIIKK